MQINYRSEIAHFEPAHEIKRLYFLLAILCTNFLSPIF